MFEASKSKLFSQIMTSLVHFFGLGASATEAEIHMKVDGKTIADYVSESQDMAAEVEDLKKRLVESEAERANLSDAITKKDGEISDLKLDAQKLTQGATDGIETLRAEHLAEVAKINDAHKKQVESLAGQISALKVGQQKQGEDGDEGHSAGKFKNADEGHVVSITGEELRKMISSQRK